MDVVETTVQCGRCERRAIQVGTHERDLCAAHFIEMALFGWLAENPASPTSDGVINRTFGNAREIMRLAGIVDAQKENTAQA